MLNVKIERIPEAFNTPSKNAQMYGLIRIALKCDRLDACINAMREYLKTSAIGTHFAIGYTGEGGHIWIHELDWQTQSEVSKNRLFIITEK